MSNSHVHCCLLVLLPHSRRAGGHSSTRCRWQQVSDRGQRRSAARQDDRIFKRDGATDCRSEGGERQYRSLWRHSNADVGALQAIQAELETLASDDGRRREKCRPFSRRSSQGRTHGLRRLHAGLHPVLRHGGATELASALGLAGHGARQSGFLSRSRSQRYGLETAARSRAAA